MDKTALIAMSGGVDSSVAAYLTQQQGYSCLGATMKLFGEVPEAGTPLEHSCCTSKDIEDARSIAQRLNMPYYVYNFAADFGKQVIDRFVEAYVHGRTPNPCIDCNRYLKFGQLFKKAQELGCDYVVTGHYAQVAYDEGSSRYQLLKAVDPIKDQSYFLYSLTQEQLAHILFPLGGLSKTQVREIAQEQGFITAEKKDSQDICFVDGSYIDFIEQRTGRKFPPGKFVTKEGQVLGKHKGIIRYTIGQRKGLGLALPEPMYVQSINPHNNTVVLTNNAGLFTKTITAKNINLIACDAITAPLRLKAKIRYRHQEEWAIVSQPEQDTLIIEFDQPQRAITKGQAVVLYDDNIVVGGGTIV